MVDCMMNAYHAFRRDVRHCGLSDELICTDGDCRICNLPLWFLPRNEDPEKVKEKFHQMLTCYEEPE